jgi:hypothetical protein
MDLQECKMIMVSIIEEAKPESTYPLVRVITIAPSRQEALEQADQELGFYRSGQNGYLSQIKDLGSILFTPVPTTVFLYSQMAGRIK